MCERYLGKARQAQGTVARASRIAKRSSLPEPTSSAYLVVTDDPIRTTPALALMMNALAPDQPERFVCGLDELELLVEYGRRGASIPSLVHNWQVQGRNISLQAHLAAKLAPWVGRPDPWDRVDLAAWIAGIPLERPPEPVVLAS